MIKNPDYITDLREKLSLSNTVTLIQLSAIGPGFYSIEALAKRLGMQRSNLNSNLLVLRKEDYIRYCGINAHGTYLYWIKEDFKDLPKKAPGYTIKDRETEWSHFVEMGELQEFAKTINCSATAIRRLVKGEQPLLLNRYEVIERPAIYK